MPRLQSSTKEYFNGNAHLDSLVALNKCNDSFLNSNFSNGYNIPIIMKLYANEIHSSYDAYKSNSSHIKSENYHHKRAEQISENTYLNSILHSSDATNSQNVNKLLHSNEKYYHNPSMDKNNSSSENRDYSSCLNSLMSTKNNPIEYFYVEDEKNLDDEYIESNLIYGNEGYNSMNGGNKDLYIEFTNNDNNNLQNYEKNLKNCREFNYSVNNLYGKQDDYYRNSSAYIKEYPNVIENSLSYDENYLKNKCDMQKRNKSCIDEKLCDNSYNMFDIDNDSGINNCQLNYSSETSERSHKGIINKHLINKGVLNDFSLDGYIRDKEYLLNDKTKTEKEFNKYFELENKNNSLIREIEDNVYPKRSINLPLGKTFSNKFSYPNEKEEKKKILRNYSENNNKEKSNTFLFNKNPKSYSLEDMRNGKVEIPSTLFMKLPFNGTDYNVIDSYQKNKKLLNFMKDCNDSVNIILKYPKIEKNKKKSLKIPYKIAHVIKPNMGSPVVYEDDFDRSNYHPNVQNLHMGKIFEKHLFSILKNKKDLGKKIFSKSEKFKQYKYDNNDGFWISNIYKQRLINPEKNNSYITELVYEKNNSYDDEMRILKSCKNYESIPTICNLIKDNNFYSFLKKEKMYSHNLNPVITNIMRKYDVEKVLNYKHIQSNESITPL